MIRARDILEAAVWSQDAAMCRVPLLEMWKKTPQGPVEVLVNPKTWRGAVDTFKRDLQTLKGVFGEKSLFLRYFFDPGSEKLWVWLGYYAIHIDIFSRSRTRDYWYGVIDIKKQIVRVNYPEAYNQKYSPSDMSELPERLREFLSGLSLSEIY